MSAKVKVTHYSVADVIDDGFPIVELCDAEGVVGYTVAGATDQDSIASAVKYAAPGFRLWATYDDAYQAFCRGETFW